jgi:hypothetical protein
VDWKLFTGCSGNQATQRKGRVGLGGVARPKVNFDVSLSCAKKVRSRNEIHALCEL